MRKLSQAQRPATETTTPSVEKMPPPIIPPTAIAHAPSRPSTLFSLSCFALIETHISQPCPYRKFHPLEISQRFSLLCGKQFPVSSTKFPVLMRREFGCK